MADLKQLAQARIFVSYSHVDREWFGKLRPLLVFDPAAVVAHIWHDQELHAGDRWDAEIRHALSEMDIFLCLVSYHFLASTYIAQVEMKSALEREKENQTLIVPLLLCDMDERDIVHLRPFNPLPAWGRSWRSYEMGGGNSMDAHRPIRIGLRDAIERIDAKKRPNRGRDPTVNATHGPS